MAENNEFPELSAMAAERQREMLPGLLAAVRWRRERRQAAQTVVLVLALVLALVWVPARGEPRSPTDGPLAATPAWTAIADDPTVVERCAVLPAVRAEWFVDDAGLQDLLTRDERSAGIVRIGGTVRVRPDAIDAWGSEADQAPDGGTGS